MLPHTSSANRDGWGETQVQTSSGAQLERKQLRRQKAGLLCLQEAGLLCLQLLCPSALHSLPNAM